MNANTYVDRPNDKGTALDRERQLATLLEDDDVLCAHVYDDSGYSEFLFHGSPENIANFIGARPMVHQIVLTDRQECPVLRTIGYFIDRCPDKVLLEEVKKVLIPIQMCETEAQPIFFASIGEVVGYQLRQHRYEYRVYPSGQHPTGPGLLDLKEQQR